MTMDCERVNHGQHNRSETQKLAYPGTPTVKLKTRFQDRRVDRVEHDEIWHNRDSFPESRPLENASHERYARFRRKSCRAYELTGRPAGTVRRIMTRMPMRAGLSVALRLGSAFNISRIKQKS